MALLTFILESKLQNFPSCPSTLFARADLQNLYNKKEQNHEVNPKVWTKNFGVYFMRKKHDHQALLKYMHMQIGRAHV